MSIPLTRPTLRRKDLNSVLSCLVSDRIGPGPLNRELAGSLSEFVQAAGGLCLCTYRSAIETALGLLELEPGDGVILSALAPREYLEALRLRGLKALIADVEPRRPTLSMQQIEAHRQVGAKAIVVHHSLGFPPQGEELLQAGLPVLEDVSHALGGRWGERPCGGAGAIAVLALEPGNIITAGCGGAVLCRERRLAKTLQGLGEAALNPLLLPDMNAALGIAQLKEIHRFLQARTEIADVFLRSVQKSRHAALIAPSEPEPGGSGAQCVHYGFPVLVREGLREVRQYAAKKNVDTQPAFRDSLVSLDAAPAAAEAPGEGDVQTAGPQPARSERLLPNARELLWRCLMFPLYPSLTRKDVAHISKVLSTLP